MGAHVDWPYWGMRPPFPATPVLTLQVIWMLEDFTLENGGMGLGKINPAVPKALIDKMNAIKQKIISGELKVPTTL